MVFIDLLAVMLLLVVFMDTLSLQGVQTYHLSNVLQYPSVHILLLLTNWKEVF